MVEQNLIDYVKGHLGQGASIEQIKEELLNAGWKNNDIDQAIYLAGEKKASGLNGEKKDVSLSSNGGVKKLRLKRIGVLSSGIVIGIMNVFVGLIFGLFATVLALVFPLGETGGIFSGVFAVIIFPIFYGVIGFISGAIGGALYNLASRIAGGIEYEDIENYQG